MNIITMPDKRLLRVAEEVTQGEDCRELIDEMLKAMTAQAGIGLAAPQLGVNKRVIVIRYNSTRYAIINPVLEPNTKIRQRLVDESCLSVPGKEMQVRRWRKVKVSGFDENWRPVHVGGKNYLAAVFQHEIDHLNGIVIGEPYEQRN